MPGSGILDRDVLTFPPVELALDDELAATVLTVPLVRDAHRLAGWTGTRGVTAEHLLSDADVAEAAAALGVDARRLRLLWVVAVNGRLIELTKEGARPGPGVADPMEFWDGVVMDVLDRTDDPAGLTGSSVIDEHLTEILATMYSVRDGMSSATLASGILQAHEVGCAARAPELRRLRISLPTELADAMDLLSYCGLIEIEGNLVRLTPRGVWAVRRDLLREGHDAPSLREVAGLAELSAAELVAALLAGRASASAATLWLERRVPEEAARDLIKVAACGNAAQRGTAGTILEELGPEAAPAVREALAEPMMWRYAAAWLGVRDLEAPALGGQDGAWVAVDTLAALLYLSDRGVDSPAKLDILGEDLLTLVPEMGAVDHPDAMAVLELLGKHHPDVVVAKAARKAAMKARSALAGRHAP